MWVIWLKLFYLVIINFIILQVVILDLLSSTSGNSFDRAIDFTLSLYTSFKNDSVFLDFGDEQNQTSNIILSKNFL